MAYMSAREMLSGLPVKMAEGGDVNEGGDVKTYGKYGATAQDIQDAAANVRDQIADGSYNAASAYAEIMASDISVEDALEALGDTPETRALIDAIFTTATPLAGDQLSSQGQASFMDSGSGFAKAITQANVDAALAKYMLDGKIDAAERLEMQKIATREGVTYQDMIDFDVDPNILYKTTAAAVVDPRPCPDGTAYNAATNTCDAITVPVDPRPCPDGTAYNAATNTCDAITDEGCPAGQESVGGVCVDICPENYTRNASGNCEADVTVCGKGYTLNPITGNCVPNNSIPDCGTGEKYNPATGKCEKIFVNTQEEYVPPTVYQPLPDNTSVYEAGEESLNREFRDSAPRTEVIDAYGGLVNFDYTPAADLLSATGSGYNWTPPTVTSRPRSLMGAAQLGRYTGGRSAADLRQLTTGLGNGRTYSDYAGVLQNPGSYSGGLSKSQLYSRMRGLDYRRDAAADRQASGARGGINAYLSANPDIAASYEAQKDQLGGQTLQEFARNHYNTTGRAEMAAGNRGLFTLVESTGGGGFTSGGGGVNNSGMGGFKGGGEDYETSNWNQSYGMGEAGGVYRPFAHGGPVKKPKGFADGGTASANLRALNKYAGGGIIDSAIQKGAEALGFDDERQVAISQEAVDITNQMVDAGLIGEQYRVELLVPKDASQRTRQNTGIKGDEEVFNAVNHALFAYDAGQSTLGTLGAQAKEVYQGLSRKIGGNDPRSEYLDYFNNKFGFNLAEQGLSREEAKNAIMNNLGNVDNQGTRGRMIRGEELKAGVDLLTNVQDARYPWE